jgi:SAM-dependent methyltransferase
MEEGRLPECCEVAAGTLTDMPAAELFDTVLYVDVLEHIEEDRAEIALATTHLRPGGWLLVLAPAHKWLYTPFDVAIGHYRRYTKTDLKRLGAEPLDCIGLRYLDSAGLLASLANRFMLKSSMPSGRQIAFWDRVMVPFSRLIDPIIGYSVGKSVLGIWRKNGVQV